MPIVQYGQGQPAGGGDYWAQFQPHDGSGGNAGTGLGGFNFNGSVDDHGVSYINWLRQNQGLPPKTAEEQGWGTGAPLSRIGGAGDGSLPQMGEGGTIQVPPSQAQPGQWQAMGGQQPGAQGGDPQQQVLALIGGRPLSPQLLTELKPQLAALGFKLQNDAPGRSDYRPRIQGPDGSVFDLGDFGGQATWVPRGKQDWSSVGGVGGGTPGQPGASGGILGALKDTPGYQFTVDEALRGVQSSAFAKGTGLTGGTLKALMDRAAGLAGTRYDTTVDQYGRAAQIGQNAIQQGSS